MISAGLSCSPDRTVKTATPLSANHPVAKSWTVDGSMLYRAWFPAMVETVPSKQITPVSEEITPPLTAQEQLRFQQLQLIVERNLESFLKCAAALKEIRDLRLYREKWVRFEDFCRERFALARSTVDGMIRSANTAQLLIEGGAQLPANTSEAVVRPVSALPSPELQSAGWKLIEAVSPECGPTQPIAAKVCRAIRNAIEAEHGATSNGHKLRKHEHLERETPFLRPVQRLSAFRGFDASVITSHVEKLPSAWTVYSACQTMIKRCQEVQHRLVERFPELANG
jgi:hypothetical protein